MRDNNDVQLLDDFVVQYNNFRNEISKVIVGQDQVVKEVLVSIFCNGHCLLVGERTDGLQQLINFNIGYTQLIILLMKEEKNG